MTFRCIEGCDAECCGNVPIPKALLKEYRNKIQRKYEKIVLKNGLIHPITADGSCIFLNRKTRKCEIHAARPKVCRLYGTIEELQCPYIDQTGKTRSPEKVIEAKQNIKHSINEHLLSYLNGHPRRLDKGWHNEERISQSLERRACEAIIPAPKNQPSLVLRRIKK